MPGKHLDLDLDNNLGGDNPADVYIPSQKAIKTYVDGEITVVNGKIDAIEIVDELAELQDVNLSEVTDGQALTYDAATQKWKNTTVDSTPTWGNITGTLSEQTDLNNALSGKADASHTHTKSQITDLAIPSKVSELQNDAGYISSVPSEYITETELSTELQGYQTKITSTAKLNSDLVTDANQTNKFVTAAQMSTWNGKQDAITDLNTIRAGASAGATALQAGDNVSALTNDAGYLTSADISAVFVYKGTKANKTDLPTTGNKKGDVWTVSADGSEYVWDGSKWEYLGETLDLSGYVQTSRTINGKALTSDITLSYSDVGALSSSTAIPTISDTYNASSSNGMSGKAVASAISTKQDTINDLTTIRANASAGAAAATTIASYGDIVSHDASEFQAAGDYAAEVHTHTISDVTDLSTTLDGKQDEIKSTNKLSSDLVDDTGKTHKFVTSAQMSTWSGKQDAISDLTTIRANASAGASAATTIASYGDIVTHSASEFLTEHQDISGKADTSSLAEVAFSGSYNDLDGKPTIPSTYTDVGAASAGHTHTYGDVGAASASHTHTYSQVGAASASHTHTYGDVGAASAAHKHTSSDVTDLNTTIGTAISGKANATEVYTKSEIDGKLTGAMHFKGTVAKVSNLPASGNVTGDMYNVSETGANYAWDGSAWDKLSENIDLSGVVPNTRTVNGKALSSDITLTYTDVSAASDAHTHSYSDVGAASDAHTHTYGDVGAASAGHTHSDLVPNTRKVAGKALTSDITLTYSDVSAASSGHTHTYSDVGAASANHTHSYVPTTRKVNNKALSSDVTLSASDVGALPSDTVIPTVPTDVSAFNNDAGYLVAGDITGKADTSSLANVAFSGAYGDLTGTPTIPSTYSDVGAASAGHTHTYSDVGAASASHTHSTYVPTSRKVAGKALTSNITLSASDVGALASDTVIPSDTGDLTNGAGFITASAIPSKVSAFTNDAGYLTEHQDISGKADTSSLANVAFSGAYTDLSGTPSIPSTYTDVGAASAAHTHTYSDVGAASTNHTHSNYVPTSRKVAGKALTSDITLTYSDVSAASSAHTHTYGDVGAASASHKHTYTEVGAASASHTHSYTYTDVGAASATHTHTYSDVGAASSSHTHSGYVATSRKVAGHALTADVTISSADIGDLSTTISSAISGKANATETYTKSEIDGKLTGAMHFKGTKASASALPSTGNTTGDMWNVTDTGANYAWDGTQWDKLSENIDLSGVVPNTRTVNGKALSSDITLTYSDVGALSSGTSIPSTYSDVNAASASHTHSNYVPTSRTINGNALTSNISLTYTDVSAASSGHTHSYSDVGAASSSHTHSGYVPTSRKVAGKSLTSDITLTYSDVSAASSAHTHTYSDVGAASDAHTHTYSQVGAASAAHTHTYSDVGAASSGHTHSGYVPTSRKVAGKALTSDITLTYSDVSAASAGHTHTYSDVGAASVGHTHSYTYTDVGAASAAHTHSYSYSDVGAASAAHTHTYSDVGAASSSHTHSNYVPTSRKVAGKALTSDITLTYSDVSAASSGHTHTYSDVGAASSGHSHTYTEVGAASASHTHSYSYTDVGAASAAHTHTYSDVGAASTNHTHSGYVATSRTVNGHALTSNVTVAPADITMTDYVIASASASVTTSDTLNQAIAKIEYKANQAASGSVTVGQLNGPRITPSNPTVTVSVSGTTVTIDGVAYTSGDLVTAILAGTAPATLEIVTYSNLRCYVFNSHYYRRDTLADITSA